MYENVLLNTSGIQVLQCLFEKLWVEPKPSQGLENMTRNCFSGVFLTVFITEQNTHGCYQFRMEAIIMQHMESLTLRLILVVNKHRQLKLEMINTCRHL